MSFFQKHLLTSCLCHILAIFTVLHTYTLGNQDMCVADFIILALLWWSRTGIHSITEVPVDLLHPLRSKMPVTIVLSANVRHWDHGSSCARCTGGQALSTGSHQTGARNPGLQGVLTWRDANSGQCFAALVVDANAQNTMKESQQRILHQFGQLTITSSDQGTHCDVYRWTDIILDVSVKVFFRWD